VRSRLTRFGIGANQFGASSCHKGATVALLDDRRQLFAYAGVDGDRNLGILTRSRGGGLLRSDGAAADRPQRYASAEVVGHAGVRLRGDARGGDVVHSPGVGRDDKMMRLDRSSSRRAMFAIPLWACAVVSAFAEQRQEAATVLGAGQKSCGEYLAAVYGLSPGRFRVETTPSGKTYGNDARALYEWLAGFISAANASSPDGVQIKTDPAAIDVWMRKHCEQNRARSVSHAAQQFVQELRIK
jgi:hypothetical protein